MHIIKTAIVIVAFAFYTTKSNNQAPIGVVSAFSPQLVRASTFSGHQDSKRIGHGQPPHHLYWSDKSVSKTTALYANDGDQRSESEDSFFDSLFREIDSRLSKGFPKEFVATIFAVVYLAIQCATVVEAGTVGIVSTFGNLERFDPGLHFRIPIVTGVTQLSTKTELLEQSNFVPTKEGLTVELDTAVLVKLDSEKATELYQTVGPDFMCKLVAPETSSSVRGLTSESEAKALYTAGRSELQNRMKAELTEKLQPKGIVIEDVLLKNVVLPKSLSDSIQEKVRAEQESARMEFVLLKETKEAQRKAIEAEGIAEFQRIVSKGINPGLLQWKGIEATEKLSKSDNTKIVIMGNSKDSLPVILGSEASK